MIYDFYGVTQESTEADVWIDDVKLQDMGLTVKLSSQEPILPATRDNIVTIPGMHGAYDYGADLEPRLFALDCMYEKVSWMDLKIRIREFVRILLDNYGRPKTVKLRFGDESDLYYNVRYSGSIPLDRLAGLGSFTLPLTAYDPHAYSVATNDEVTWGSQEITFANTFFKYGDTNSGEVKTITSPQSIPIKVNGLVAMPIITISGSGTNVTLSVNRKTMSIGSFTSTNWLIDLGAYAILKNGANGLSSYSGDWLEFMPGDNQFSIAGSGLNLSVQVKIRDKFM